MRKFKAGVPLFAIILTFLAFGMIAFKGVVKKGEETSKVVFADQWYEITLDGTNPDPQKNQKLTRMDSEPTGPNCNTSNSGVVCGVIITFPGAIPPFSVIEGKTVSQILIAYSSATLNYTKEP